MERQRALDSAVFMALVALTALTIASSLFAWARIMAVTIALAIAAVKAGLIGFYYMDLKDEGPLVYGIVVTGLTALAILCFGILPDMAGAR
ncbi:MAG: cytochrome C oxidase subunit IV family protein [Elusimicrobia bacterium]|nr:cytochrome C oxidase subunit IV family protein [Elusimicrobiota bacterium]